VPKSASEREKNLTLLWLQATRTQSAYRLQKVAPQNADAPWWTVSKKKR
jgi:hypothetical protein